MIKPPLLQVCSALALVATASTLTPMLQAGQVTAGSNRSVQSIADREIARRNDQVARAQAAILEGDKALGTKDYEAAIVHYKQAADILPESPVTHKLRSAAVDRYARASVRLAEQQIAEGNLAQAELTAKAVLKEGYAPRHSGARAIVAHLAEPGYYNPVNTPAFHAKVEEVKKLFVEAQGFYDLGRYQFAEKRYNQILALDPTNVAAREGLIRIDKVRMDYHDRAYEENRANMLDDVAKSWERRVPKYNAPDAPIGGDTQQGNNTSYINNKLTSIIIPKVEFKDATVRECVDYLKRKSIELDKDPNVERRGVNIVLQLETPEAPPAAAPVAPDAGGMIPGLDPSAADAGMPALPGSVPAVSGPNPNDVRITLSLSNLPLAEVLRYITTLAGLKLKVEPYAVSLVPLNFIIATLITKEYKVPPGTFTSASAPSTSIGAAPMPISNGNMTSGPMGARVGAKEYFTNLGVQFPPGAAANFVPTTSRLIVRNTQEQLELVDALVEALNTSVPLQVSIEAKFVEVTQTNLKELSFDWQIGPFKIHNGKNLSVGGAGGTYGSTDTPDQSNYPWSIDNTVPLTSGLRSGRNAITSNAIDSFLYPTIGAASKAPGIASVAGLIRNTEFQAVIRALDQKKGVDLLSSPSVTCKSGQEAEIEVVRELRYPTEFTPPQLPTSSGGGGSGTTVMEAIVTPTTPTTFEMRQTGVKLHVQPTVGTDNSTIDLQLEPQVVEFEGFINYGSPIYSSRGLLTENIINQPVFSSRKVRTQVSIWDGQTVVLGGLMREDVQKVEDKVPLLGDLPLLGRLFRSSVDQHQKRNLVIFVTARLINPAGDPISLSDELKEDEVEIPTAATLPGDDVPPLLPAMLK